MMELTEQQQRALEASVSPPRVVDPRTNRSYVLLPVEEYERLKDLLEPGPLSEAERRVVLAGVWRRANWDDPLMQAYDAEPGNDT